MYPIFCKPFGELTADQLHRIVQARETVFYLEQHVTCLDADAVDPQSTFLWMEHAGQVVAFLRLVPAGVIYPEVSLGRVLVAADFRRQGLCRELMQTSFTQVATLWGAQPIRISAQHYLEGFYASLGFETVSEIYLEAGIHHVKMLRR